MDWFFSWFRRRMQRVAMQDVVALSTSSTINVSATAKAGTKRIELLSAINGKVLEIAYRRQANADWDVHLYIVRDDEALADAVATALLVTGEN
jgi:hypothetical protein